MGAGASSTAKKDKYAVTAAAKELGVTAPPVVDTNIELLQKELAAKDQQLQAIRLEVERSIRSAPIWDADQKAGAQTHLESPADTRERTLTIYCNGVYDMCHIGHQAFFQKAGAKGNLIVGVHGDEACGRYKRPPIMSADERARQVAGCKGVWAVLKNAPLENITKDFMDEYDIDVVALGEEYLQQDVKDDKWYSYPRESGKTISLTRTDGISTSDLINRCADSVSGKLRSDGEARENRSKSKLFLLHRDPDPNSMARQCTAP